VGDGVRDWVAACLKMEVISYILLLYISRINRYYAGSREGKEEEKKEFRSLGMNKKNNSIKIIEKVHAV
jgi:hypothetical protein